MTNIKSVTTGVSFPPAGSVFAKRGGELQVIAFGTEQRMTGRKAIGTGAGIAQGLQKSQELPVAESLAQLHKQTRNPGVVVEFPKREPESLEA